MKTDESCHGCTAAIHPFGGLANTGSALNNHAYLRSSVADCFFQDYFFLSRAKLRSMAPSGTTVPRFMPSQRRASSVQSRLFSTSSGHHG
jgi:hypothetical protein